MEGVGEKERMQDLHLLSTLHTPKVLNVYLLYQSQTTCWNTYLEATNFQRRTDPHSRACIVYLFMHVCARTCTSVQLASGGKDVVVLMFTERGTPESCARVIVCW